MSAAASPRRRASALSSSLARSSSHLTRRVASRTACATRSPTDWPPPSRRTLAAERSAIALSPLPPVRFPWGQAHPSGCPSTAPTGAVPAAFGSRVNAAAVMSRLRQKILRDHQPAAGHHVIGRYILEPGRTSAHTPASRAQTGLVPLSCSFAVTTGGERGQGERRPGGAPFPCHVRPGLPGVHLCLP